MRSFHQAGNYTDVDPKVVTAGLDFLVSKQKESGEFPEVGKLFDNANQNALALTSFVLLAFFENHVSLLHINISIIINTLMYSYTNF